MSGCQVERVVGFLLELKMLKTIDLNPLDVKPFSLISAKVLLHKFVYHDVNNANGTMSPYMELSL